MAWDDLPLCQFAFPGPLRDQLVEAVLTGAKTTTTGLLEEYEHDDEPLPQPGQRYAVVDSLGKRVAVIETVEIRVIPLRTVDERFARDEGEGYTTVEEWRTAHERYWRGEPMREYLGREPRLDDETLVVAERFRLVETLPRG